MWGGRIYVAALCSPCNLRITLKLNYLKIYGHNATRYDNHLVLNGITDEFKVVNMIAKSGENFIKISIKKQGRKYEKKGHDNWYGLCFKDSLNFLSFSLDKLSKSLKKIKKCF